MKKLMLIILTVIACSCGDKNNRASENSDANTDGRDQVVEPDSTSTMSDSTAIPSKKDSIK